MGFVRNLAINKTNNAMSRLMAVTEEVVKFLNGEFRLPKRLENPREWFDVYSKGEIVDSERMTEIASEAIAIVIKEETDKATEWLTSFKLTKKQLEDVPKAVIRFEKFMQLSVSKHRAIKEKLEGKKATQTAITAKEEAETAKAETATTSKDAVEAA